MMKAKVPPPRFFSRCQRCNRLISAPYGAPVECVICGKAARALWPWHNPHTGQAAGV